MATVHTNARPVGRRPKLRRAVTRGNIIRHIVLAFAAILFGGPFLWMVLSSFKGSAELLSSPTLLPIEWRFDNYSALFLIAPFGTYFLNSTIVAVAATAGQVVTSLAAGFAFSRLRFPGRNVIFIVLLVALMVPFELVFTPLASLLSSLHWLNSFQGLIVPNIPSIFGAFLFRQFFDSFPGEIEEASRIDGASVWQRFRLIMTPMARPMIASFAILSFVYNWNNFFFQLVVVNKSELFTVQLGLALLQTQQGQSNFNLLMAASTLAVVPVLVIFLLFQNQIVRALSGGLR
jgi:multiple sugar transport system permease protein